ncbi:MAG: hypothetical protein PHO37_16380 [Kiritimatiellae bacterium]|nr:hypothetical protein [Kiritimatiellia bacterium]
MSLVTEYVEGEIERWDFDLDYSGYVIEHFPAFQAETPRLSTRFANTIDRTYSYGAALSDDSFRKSMAYALDEFCGAIKPPDIWQCPNPFDAYHCPSKNRQEPLFVPLVLSVRYATDGKHQETTLESGCILCKTGARKFLICQVVVSLLGWNAFILNYQLSV